MLTAAAGLEYLALSIARLGDEVLGTMVIVGVTLPTGAYEGGCDAERTPLGILNAMRLGVHNLPHRKHQRAHPED